MTETNIKVTNECVRVGLLVFKRENRVPTDIAAGMADRSRYNASQADPCHYLGATTHLSRKNWRKVYHRVSVSRPLTFGRNRHGENVHFSSLDTGVKA